MPSQIEVQGTTKIGFQTKTQFFEKRNLQGQSPFRKSGSLVLPEAIPCPFETVTERPFKEREVRLRTKALEKTVSGSSRARCEHAPDACIEGNDLRKHLHVYSCKSFHKLRIERIECQEKAFPCPSDWSW